MAAIWDLLTGGGDDPVRRRAVTAAWNNPGNLWAKLGTYRAAVESPDMVGEDERIMREAFTPAQKKTVDLVTAPAFRVNEDRPASFDFDTAQKRLLAMGNLSAAEKLVKLQEDQRKAAGAGGVDWTGTLRDAVDDAGNPVLLGMTNRGPEVVRGFRPAGGGEAPRRSTREDEYGRKVTEEFRNGKWEVISVGPMPERAPTPQTVIYDEKGSAYFVDPRNPGAAPKPILTSDGRPIAKPEAAPKPATEGERNAAGYLSRMEAAEKLLGSFAPMSTRGDKLAAAYSPGSDGILKNMLMSTEGQQYQQAAMDWIRAKLRKESGAAIGQDEAEQEYRTYFPMPGDGPEKIRQKAAARKEAMKSSRFSAGAAYSQNAGGDGPVTVRTPDGRMIRFPNKKAADNFKLRAGIR
ncbi:MAG: hypothetical protein ABFD94_20725 [Armatimonadia bacterium]